MGESVWGEGGGDCLRGRGNRSAVMGAFAKLSWRSAATVAFLFWTMALALRLILRGLFERWSSNFCLSNWAAFSASRAALARAMLPDESIGFVPFDAENCRRTEDWLRVSSRATEGERCRICRRCGVPSDEPRRIWSNFWASSSSSTVFSVTATVMFRTARLTESREGALSKEVMSRVVRFEWEDAKLTWTKSDLSDLRGPLSWARANDPRVVPLEIVQPKLESLLLVSTYHRDWERAFNLPPSEHESFVDSQFVQDQVDEFEPSLRKQDHSSLERNAQLLPV